MHKLIISFIILALLIVKSASGQLYKGSYFYAYGVDEINIYWDYHFDYYPEELLGCNVLRYDNDPEQAFQLNQELITSIDKDFYYLDTFNIVDTAIYFYKVEFVFPGDTSTFSCSTGSFESIEFNTVGPTTVELVAIPKNQGIFYVDVYWDNQLVTLFTEEDTFILEMDPFDLELYTNYIIYWVWDFEGNDNGTILTSIFHLKELLLTQTPEYFIAEISMDNFPNPLTEYTNINLDVAESDNYNIAIYNSYGELIKTLENKFLITGKHDITWNRKNDMGNRVPNGLYYCFIKSNRMKKALKLIVQ